MSRNLSKLSQSKLKDFLNSFDNVFIDCDGVILFGDTLIEGVKESLDSLKQLGKKMWVITNNCTRNDSDWDSIFKAKGVCISSPNVIYPTKAILNYLNEQNFNKKAFVLGSSVMKQMLTDGRIEIYDHKYEGVLIDGFKELKEIRDDINVGAVVVDIDFNISYIKMMQAVEFLRRNDVLFLCGAIDKYYPINTNRNILGGYFYLSALEILTGRTSFILAKPGGLFGDYLRKKIQVDHTRTLFIGDSLETDMRFAKTCGYIGLLVLNGVTDFKTLEKCSAVDKPGYYLESLGHLNAILKEKNII